MQNNEHPMIIEAGNHWKPALDVQKAAADFLIVSMQPVAIRWKRGMVEIITRYRLDSLKKTHTWATDF